MTPPLTPTAAAVPESRAYVFDRDRRTAALARHQVRADLTDWNVPEERIESAVQVVSEIATNAVEHTQSMRIRLEVERHPEEIRIAVRDSGPRPQAPLDTYLTAPADLAEGGRGLLLVQLLAARWGAEPTPGNGLRVWAAIPAGDQQ